MRRFVGFAARDFLGLNSVMSNSYTALMEVHNISAENVIFSARLTPYRSLGPRGFKILIGFVGSFCFVAGLVFFALGMWPVVGFLGLDLLLVWWAFRSNYASARAYEDIEISRHQVFLRKVSAKGKATDHTFPQFGTRFEVDRHSEIGITDMRLANRDRSVSLGYFLNPLDRESFASAVQRALSVAKR